MELVVSQVTKPVTKAPGFYGIELFFPPGKSFIGTPELQQFVFLDNHLVLVIEKQNMLPMLCILEGRSCSNFAVICWLPSGF
jgi:hypothetical protein